MFSDVPADRGAVSVVAESIVRSIRRGEQHAERYVTPIGMLLAV